VVFKSTGILLKILILKFLQRSIDEIFCKVLRLYLLAYIFIDIVTTINQYFSFIELQNCVKISSHTSDPVNHFGSNTKWKIILEISKCLQTLKILDKTYLELEEFFIILELL
jgi:hypothetical protein